MCFTRLLSSTFNQIAHVFSSPVELDLEKSKLSKIMKDKERQMTEETSEKKSALYEELEKKLREVQAGKYLIYFRAYLRIFQLLFLHLFFCCAC